MPSSLQPRNVQHYLMRPPLRFVTGNEPGSLIFYKGLTSPHEDNLPHNGQENAQSNENYREEQLDDISEVGVIGRQELGRSDENIQRLLAIASNYTGDGQDPIGIHQHKNGEDGLGILTNEYIIETLQIKGYAMSVIQKAMDKLWSEMPASHLTPEDVDREIQRQQMGSPDVDTPTNVVLVGDGLTGEDIKDLEFQNKKLRERSICKVCGINAICVSFFPCGHLICCIGCFSNVKDRCQICQNHIVYGVQLPGGV